MRHGIGYLKILVDHRVSFHQVSGGMQELFLTVWTDAIGENCDCDWCCQYLQHMIEGEMRPTQKVPSELGRLLKNTFMCIWERIGVPMLFDLGVKWEHVCYMLNLRSGRFSQLHLSRLFHQFTLDA